MRRGEAAAVQARLAAMRSAIAAAGFSPEKHGWNHRACERCFIARRGPHVVPVQLVVVPGVCCFCALPTVVGIFVREKEEGLACVAKGRPT